MFLLNAPFREGGGAFIRRGRLKEGGVYKMILIFRGALIRGFTVCDHHILNKICKNHKNLETSVLFIAIYMWPKVACLLFLLYISFKIHVL